VQRRTSVHRLDFLLLPTFPHSRTADARAVGRASRPARVLQNPLLAERCSASGELKFAVCYKLTTCGSHDKPPSASNPDDLSCPFSRGRGKPDPLPVRRTPHPIDEK
jgi:hypothetical protein